jgi:hypothetical protein
MRLILFLSLTMIIALAMVACGGDDGGQPAIRTQSGLAVALAADAGHSAQD